MGTARLALTRLLNVTDPSSPPSRNVALTNPYPVVLRAEEGTGMQRYLGVREYQRWLCTCSSLQANVWNRHTILNAKKGARWRMMYVNVLLIVRNSAEGSGSCNWSYFAVYNIMPIIIMSYSVQNTLALDWFFPTILLCAREHAHCMFRRNRPFQTYKLALHCRFFGFVARVPVPGCWMFSCSGVRLAEFHSLCLVNCKKRTRIVQRKAQGAAM
jgi:hypothetical protein